MSKARQKKVSRVLRKALSLMNNSGAHWIKGSYKNWTADGELGYCSVGAIREAMDQVPDGWDVEEDAYSAVAYGLPSAEDEATDRIIGWNDNERRTWPDIVKRFEAAIARQET